MKRPWQYLTRADLVVIVLLGVAALLGLLDALSAPRGQRVVVTDGEQLLYLGHLDRGDTVILQGPLGKTHLQIDASGAQITAAPCPLKTCMRMGPANRQGDLLACVPNRILVQIEGNGPEGSSYDLLSR